MSREGFGLRNEFRFSRSEDDIHSLHAGVRLQPLMDGAQILSDQSARQIDALAITRLNRSMAAYFALCLRRQISITRQRDDHSTRTISPRTFFHRANNLSLIFALINN